MLVIYSLGVTLAGNSQAVRLGKLSFRGHTRVALGVPQRGFFFLKYSLFALVNPKLPMRATVWHVS